MIIGVPNETGHEENRVALTPYAVSRLTKCGHTVIIERSAGISARFSDEEYQRSGAQIAYNNDEPYKRADLVCRVGQLQTEELDRLKEGTVVAAFHHLSVMPRLIVEQLIDFEATVIAYELIRDAHGNHPILLPFSEMAGQMAVHIAANCLTHRWGGRGILLGTVPGIPAPTVLILGAGTVGRTAALHALANGARVIVLDENVDTLRKVSHDCGGQVETFIAGADRLRVLTAVADVVIGAVLIPGAKAPFLVTEDMVKGMKKGSVIVDVSIDQGGCVETSRPTTIEKATFVLHDVVHYCVPNMTSNIARTASRALADALYPYLLNLGSKGIDGALLDDPGLCDGIYLYRGKIVNQQLANTMGVAATPLQELVPKGGQP
jgi:alanine dehydrogenase